MSLGIGIDGRGGDALGFVSIRNGTIRHERIPGSWGDIKGRKLRKAYGDLCMMHARYATCGIPNRVTHAHPFPIKRNGKVVLYGAHNGMVYNAQRSAERNARKYTVDSKELFELIADGKSTEDLYGYGVITWLYPESQSVKVCRLTRSADFTVAQVGSGVVWASTYDILKDACKFAGLKIKSVYDDLQIGIVYEINKRGLYYLDNRIQLSEPRSYSEFSDPEEWWQQEFRRAQ